MPCEGRECARIGAKLWLDSGRRTPPEGRFGLARSQERASARLLSTVWARRFCDQQEMSLQTATGRSLP
jgi:hypothetical protein